MRSIVKGYVWINIFFCQKTFFKRFAPHYSLPPLAKWCPICIIPSQLVLLPIKMSFWPSSLLLWHANRPWSSIQEEPCSERSELSRTLPGSPQLHCNRMNQLFCVVSAVTASRCGAPGNGIKPAKLTKKRGVIDTHSWGKSVTGECSHTHTVALEGAPSNQGMVFNIWFEKGRGAIPV